MFTFLFGCHWVIQQVLHWFTHGDNVPQLEGIDEDQDIIQTSSADTLLTQPPRTRNVQYADQTDGGDLVDTDDPHDVQHVYKVDVSHHLSLKRKHLPDNQGKPQAESHDDNDADDDDSVVSEDFVIPAKSSKLSATIPTVDHTDNDESSEPEFNVTQVYGYSELPFLCDTHTVDFIKSSHTLFIMRGLPGSGKSTMVKGLQEVYKDLAVVCSADHFFMKNDGTYKFIQSKLPEAHQFCQGKAGYHCEKGTRVIIIDNTNIARWEMSHYLKLAQSQHFYHVIIVEPLTPWRYDPVELAKRNSHSVDVELIEEKLKTLQNNLMRPMYYGWFLTRADSSMLVNKAKEILQQCTVELLTSEDWNDNTANPYLLNEISENLGESYTAPLPMLHCTAAYLARRSRDPYHTCENVTQAIGRKFSLHISGFVFSKRAISARVNLRSTGQSGGESMCTNDTMYRRMTGTRDTGTRDTGTRDAGTRNTGTCDTGTRDTGTRDAGTRDTGTRDENNWLLHLFLKDEEEILQEKYRDTYTEDNREKHVLLQHGTSAHITLCYNKEGQSKNSGDDILNICELEFYGNSQSYVTRVGKLSVYGNDMCQIELNSQINVDTLFHPFYSSRG